MQLQYMQQLNSWVTFEKTGYLEDSFSGLNNLKLIKSFIITVGPWRIRGKNKQEKSQ